jgi:hypothetical protein
MNTSRLVAVAPVALLALALLALGSMLRPGPSEAQAGSMHNCPLAGKWSMAVWSGQSGTAAGDALASCGAGAVDAAYALDPQTQAWSRWFAGKPDVSNLPPLDDMQAVLALGSASAPVVTPTPTSTPTPAAKPAPGTVLYEADWSQGPNGWQQAYGWSVLDGMLVNDGSDDAYSNNWISAPYHPGDAGIANYAIEAEIQVVQWPDFSHSGFGVVLRSGYQAGICNWGWGVSSDATIKELGEGCWEALKKSDFDPGTQWHVYRAEITSNSVALLIDGAQYIQVTDNRHLEGANVGLWGGNFQVSVRSLKVIAV